MVVDEGSHIAGYYTLVAAEVDHTAASPSVRAGTSRHFPIPVCLIARLAVDESWQGRGLGRDLLRDATRRALAASEHIGIRAVVVEATDGEATIVYRRRGFEAVTADGLSLMVPIAMVRSRLAG